MYGCTADVEITELYPPVLNHAPQVSIVERVVKGSFGESAISSSDLPIYAGEDFSFFL